MPVLFAGRKALLAGSNRKFMNCREITNKPSTGEIKHPITVEGGVLGHMRHSK